MGRDTCGAGERVGRKKRQRERERETERHRERNTKRGGKIEKEDDKTRRAKYTLLI